MSVSDMPDPCRRCPVMRKHGCILQKICTKVKEHRRREIERNLNGQAIERAYRVQKTHSRKYKGGAM